MGIINKIEKSTIYIFTAGILLIIFSLGTLTYMSSKGVENKIYRQLNGFMGPKGSDLEGLRFIFNKDDLSCFGLIKFSCSIDNPIIDAPSVNQKIFIAKRIEVGDFSRKGIYLGRKIDLTINIIDIETSEDYNLTKNMTKEGKEINKRLFPISLSLELKNEIYSSGEYKSNIKLKLNSKISDISLFGNIIRKREKQELYVDNNLDITRDKNKSIANKSVPLSMKTILTDFELNINNHLISDTLYKVYSYYIDNFTMDIYKENLNIRMLGYSGTDKVNRDIFKKELINRVYSFVPDNEKDNYKEYLDVISQLIKKDNNFVNMIGINTNEYSLEELKTANKLKSIDKNPLLYYKIKVNTGVLN